MLVLTRQIVINQDYREIADFYQNNYREADRKERLLNYVKATELIPELMGVSGHIMATGRKK
ncbi:hypothetical protein I6N95_25190 [Vagococcus sp. BWB3-3]|uniref:Uncharacterized protein n=1 Tax=Vagococcus allomyrinae TaxID=2794353 RepID=A0A940SZD0_9ENTE|nr:hypothetical protein [Vagococcus allomyrinae]MBP1044308.1 hypothetical protein [Vagococcus allomyrinae]